MKPSDFGSGVWWAYCRFCQRLLGRFHNQVSVLREGRERHFMHYFSLGFNRFSVMPIYLSKLPPKSFSPPQPWAVSVPWFQWVLMKNHALRTFLPTQLLRALIVRDVDMAVGLGRWNWTKKTWRFVLSSAQANTSTVLFCVKISLKFRRRVKHGLTFDV